MSVSAVSGSGGAGVTGAAMEAEVLGKEDFLRLLVAKLTHQDPLDPAEDTEFVAQLAQFSSLEQLMGIGDGIAGLGLAVASAGSADTVGFIGKEVLAAADEVTLAGEGGAAMGWSLRAPAAKVRVEIRGAGGVVVRTEELAAQTAGNHRWHWDGLDDEGRAVAPGPYSIRVTATGTDGGEVPAEPLVGGQVTGVTFERGYPELRLGGLKVMLSEVREVNG